jgi:hypothetical protein
MMKLAMTVSPTPALPRERERGALGSLCEFHANGGT